MNKIIGLTIVTRKLQTRFEAWAADNRGATAVEFALIATPFFLLIFGLLEVSLIFIISTTLEFGLNDATRGIRTGAFQAGGGGPPNLATFRTAVCDGLFALLDCSEIEFDLTAHNNFNGTPPPPATNPSTGMLNSGAFSFQPGGPSQIVIARAFFEWDLITPIISQPLSNVPSGDVRLITAVAAFQNEPF